MIILKVWWPSEWTRRSTDSEHVGYGVELEELVEIEVGLVGLLEAFGPGPGLFRAPLLRLRRDNKQTTILCTDYISYLQDIEIIGQSLVKQ